MKYLKSYNESLYGEISRLNPNRLSNDEYAYDVFDEMKEDFEKYDRDLKKVKIIDDNGSIVKIGSSIDLGRNAKLFYLFGEYHPVNNDHHSGNNKAGNREIIIKFLPFSVVLKKNSLEKAFNTNRVSPLKVNMIDKKWVNNPIYNPNISGKIKFNEEPTKREREMMVRLKEEENDVRISPDISGRIFKYFLKEFNVQYPKLKKGTIKGSTQIRDIQKDVEPTIKYIHVRNKDGVELTYSLRYGDNENEIRKMLYNMTRDEYDIFWKKRNNDLYKDSNDKREIEKDKVEKEINELIVKYDIKLESKSEYEKFGYRLSYNPPYSLKIDFRILGEWRYVFCYSRPNRSCGRRSKCRTNRHGYT